jgi:glycosyltransferase involved in cell wall biosynthesis
MPTVSIIVPNYNHARYLRKRVESILTQTYQDFELILLDDCSTDESREVLNSYRDNSKVRIEFNSENSGNTFKQWNKGVRLAGGKYVWIAESDDYADEHLLKTLVARLEAEGSIVLAYCRSWEIGADDEGAGFADLYLERIDPEHWKKDFVSDGAEECRRFFVNENPVPNASAVVFRRAVYEKVGGADEDLRLCGDYKLWAAIALEGRISYTAEPLNFYRTHSESVRTRIKTDWVAIAEYFYVKRWIATRVATASDRSVGEDWEWTYGRRPGAMAPHEQVRYLIESISYLVSCLPNDDIRGRFGEWQLALYEAEFELSPPSRWRFFLYRCKFYAYYFPLMSWQLKLASLARLAGALLRGYRNRHDPEQLFARVRQMPGTARRR